MNKPKKKRAKRRPSGKAEARYFTDRRGKDSLEMVEIVIRRPIANRGGLFSGKKIGKLQPKGIEFFKLTPPEPKKPKRAKKTAHQLDLEEIRLEKAVKRAEDAQWRFAAGKSKAGNPRARYEKAIEKLEAFRRKRKA